MLNSLPEAWRSRRRRNGPCFAPRASHLRRREGRSSTNSSSTSSNSISRKEISKDQRTNGSTGHYFLESTSMLASSAGLSTGAGRGRSESFKSWAWPRRRRRLRRLMLRPVPVRPARQAAYCCTLVPCIRCMCRSASFSSTSLAIVMLPISRFFSSTITCKQQRTQQKHGCGGRN